MSKGIFITGTGTDVGKTFVTGLLVKKLRSGGINAGYYKSALSGAQRINGNLIAGDAKYVCNISGIKEDPSTLVSYIYETPVSPHLATKIEGNPLELDVVYKDYKKAMNRYDYVFVEGSGGIVCPLRIDKTKKIMLTDVIKKLHLSVVIVATAFLGTINNTVLTVEYARANGIDVKGIILNFYDENNLMHRDNKKQIEILTELPVIACVYDNSKDFDIETEQLCKCLWEDFK